MAKTSMSQRAFVNSNGDFLIVPQQGSLDIQTEFGPLFVQPGEICVIQMGQRFRIELPDGPSRGYILEVLGTNFDLPELGPLGANGLANLRDFLTPKARYESRRRDGRLSMSLVESSSRPRGHSLFDVVAWHDNYVSSSKHY